MPWPIPCYIHHTASPAALYNLESECENHKAPCSRPFTLFSACIQRLRVFSIRHRLHISLPPLRLLLVLHPPFRILLRHMPSNLPRNLRRRLHHSLHRRAYRRFRTCRRALDTRRHGRRHRLRHPNRSPRPWDRDGHRQARKDRLHRRLGVIVVALAAAHLLVRGAPQRHLHALVVEGLRRVPRDVAILAAPVAVPLADVDLGVAFPVQVVEHAFAAVLALVVAEAGQAQVEVPAHVADDGHVLLGDGAAASELVPGELAGGGSFFGFGAVVLCGDAAGQEEHGARGKVRGGVGSGRCKGWEGEG